GRVPGRMDHVGAVFAVRLGSSRLLRAVPRRNIFAVSRQELVDVLKRQLRWILAAPTCQRRADWLGRLVAGDVVATEATVPADRPPGDILDLFLRAVIGILVT